MLVALIMWAVDADTDISNESFTRYASYFSGVFMILFGVYFIHDIIQHDKSGLGFRAVATSDTTDSVELPEMIGESQITTCEEPNELSSLTPRTVAAKAQAADASPAPVSAEPPKLTAAMLRRAAASFFAGVVGGVAGPGGVLAIVPASYYSTKIEAVSYIVLFIVASTASMGLFALAYGRITATWVMTSLNRQRQETKLKLVSAIASLLVGIVWIILTALNVIKLD